MEHTNDTSLVEILGLFKKKLKHEHIKIYGWEGVLNIFLNVRLENWYKLFS